MQSPWDRYAFVWYNGNCLVQWDDKLSTHRLLQIRQLPWEVSQEAIANDLAELLGVGANQLVVEPAVSVLSKLPLEIAVEKEPFAPLLIGIEVSIAGTVASSELKARGIRWVDPAAFEDDIEGNQVVCPASYSLLKSRMADRLDLVVIHDSSAPDSNKRVEDLLLSVQQEWCQFSIRPLTMRLAYPNHRTTMKRVTMKELLRAKGLLFAVDSIDEAKDLLEKVVDEVTAAIGNEKAKRIKKLHRFLALLPEKAKSSVDVDEQQAKSISATLKAEGGTFHFWQTEGMAAFQRDYIRRNLEFVPEKPEEQEEKQPDQETDPDAETILVFFIPNSDIGLDLRRFVGRTSELQQLAKKLPFGKSYAHAVISASDGAGKSWLARALACVRRYDYQVATVFFQAKPNDTAATIQEQALRRLFRFRKEKVEQANDKQATKVSLQPERPTALVIVDNITDDNVLTELLHRFDVNLGNEQADEPNSIHATFEERARISETKVEASDEEPGEFDLMAEVIEEEEEEELLLAEVIDEEGLVDEDKFEFWNVHLIVTTSSKTIPVENEKLTLGVLRQNEAERVLHEVLPERRHGKKLGKADPSEDDLIAGLDDEYADLIAAQLKFHPLPLRLFCGWKRTMPEGSPMPFSEHRLKGESVERLTQAIVKDMLLHIAERHPHTLVALQWIAFLGIESVPWSWIGSLVSHEINKDRNEVEAEDIHMEEVARVLWNSAFVEHHSDMRFIRVHDSIIQLLRAAFDSDIDSKEWLKTFNSFLNFRTWFLEIVFLPILYLEELLAISAVLPRSIAQEPTESIDMTIATVRMLLWEELNQTGDLLADQLLARLDEKIEGGPKDTDERLSLTSLVFGQGSIYYIKDDHETSESCFKKAISEAEALIQEDETKRAPCVIKYSALRHLAEIKLQGGDYKTSIKFLQESIEFLSNIEKVEFDPESVQRAIAGICGELASAFSLFGDFAQTRATIERQLTILETLVENEPDNFNDALNLSLAYMSLVNYFFDAGDLHGVEHYSHLGLDLVSRIHYSYPNEPIVIDHLAIYHDKIGTWHRDRGEFTQALQQYRIALNHQVGLTKRYPKVDYYEKKVAGSKSQIGKCYQSLGRTLEAKLEFEAAIAKAEPILKKYPKDVEYLHEFGGFLISFADTLRNLGERESARKTYERALTVLRRMDSLTPEAYRRKHSLYLVLSRLTNFYSRVGNTTLAFQFATQAFEVAKLIYTKTPRDRHNAEAYCSAIQELSHFAFERGDYSKARAQREQVLPIRRDLWANANGDIAQGQFLITALRNVAKASEYDGALEHADKYLNEALALTHELQRIDSNKYSVEIDLGLVHGELGDFYFNRDAYDLAKQHYDHAYQVFHKLYSSKIDNEKILRCYATSATDIAFLAFKTGDLESAGRWYSYVEKLYTEYLSKNEDGIRETALAAECQLKIAEIFTSRQDFAGARDRYEKGWALLLPVLERQLDSEYFYLRTLSFLNKHLEFEEEFGDFNSTMEVIQKSERISSHAMNHYSGNQRVIWYRWLVLSSYFELYQRTNQLQEAKTALDRLFVFSEPHKGLSGQGIYFNALHVIALNRKAEYALRSKNAANARQYLIDAFRLLNGAFDRNAFPLGNQILLTTIQILLLVERTLGKSKLIDSLQAKQSEIESWMTSSGIQRDAEEAANVQRVQQVLNSQRS